MPQARRIGHATFEIPDLEREIDHWVNVAGLVLAERDGKTAYLATKVGQLVIELHEGERGHCTGLSFEVSPKTDFAQLAKELAAEGVASNLSNDTAPGLPRALTFEDPKGTKVQLFSQWSYLGDHHQVSGVGPMKLGHVAFVTPDVQGVTSFYQNVLGFRISDWIGDWFSFMRCGPDHHTVNFVRGETTHLAHIAFEVKDMAQIAVACDLLGTKKIPLSWGPVRHGPGHNVSIYHEDPDKNTIEFYIELDQMKDEELGYFDPRPWHRDLPQRPKVWQSDTLQIWGMRKPR
jgi:catechol 2,3-dioxygenase-like lactoylglutathione lyase family enzyme